ncbi:glycosyl hydrolase family 28-related protein [Nonomuraea sp. NPDC050643]|uniref:glycosyl hydrolase family 28-related protein n=1 Tax=Nonomuraea sp. NPDC050643 TaxID=3155660 RepID=UPI003400EBCB
MQPHPLSRRTLLGGIAALPALPQTTPPTTRARPHDTSTELLQQWATAPGTHPLIPDIAQAGHHHGTHPPRHRVVTTVTHFGARPDGTTDSAPAFNAAIRATGERGGGAVHIPRGTYLLTTPIFMHWSHVVLRGAGRDTTILRFTRPLDDGYRPARQSNGNSRWSWTGGQIWFLTPERRARSEAEDYAGTEGWLPGDTLAHVAAASRGQHTLLVTDTTHLHPGDLVILECDNPPDATLLMHLAGDTPGTRTYDWPRRAPQLVTDSGGQYPQYALLQRPVRIEAVLGPRLIRLTQPLRHDLRPTWPARLRAPGPTVHDSGVEDLTLRNDPLPMTPHNRHPGSNGVCFQAVHDCWARNVRVENCDLGFGLTTATANTLTHVTVAGRSAHHSFACRMQSHDNLIDHFTIEPFTTPTPAGAVHHGLNLEGLSSGNVWRRGTMAEGTFDSHRALPFDNARTDITLTNNGRVGGSAASGPLFGARITHWNIRITNASPYAITIADVAPRSLTLGVQGTTTTDSELTPDFTGDLENLLTGHGTRPHITDLYAAQRDHLHLD